MPHKKHSSRLVAVDHPDTAARETGKASSNISPQPLMSMKHDLSDDAHQTASDRFKKRRKSSSNTGLHHHDLPSPDIPATTINEKPQNIELAPETPAQNLPHEVRHLSTKYDFSTMSILSSAKINDKVKKLLLRVENFSFADPKCKPGVVVLHAKSDVASKMVSIVEIARQGIERNRGKWWQYSKVDGKIAELKEKLVKRKGDGKTLSEWQKERARGESQGIVEAGVDAERASEEVISGDEEIEDAYESMVSSKEADQIAKQNGDGTGRKIRATPVMTIYFARVPVPGLKELYGEQTNL